MWTGTWLFCSALGVPQGDPRLAIMVTNMTIHHFPSFCLFPLLLSLFLAGFSWNYLPSKPLARISLSCVLLGESKPNMMPRFFTCLFIKHLLGTNGWNQVRPWINKQTDMERVVSNWIRSPARNKRGRVVGEHFCRAVTKWPSMTWWPEAWRRTRHAKTRAALKCMWNIEGDVEFGVLSTRSDGIWYENQGRKCR